MPNDSEMKKSALSKKEVRALYLKGTKEIITVLKEEFFIKPKPPDVVFFVESYFKQHPEAKRTRHLVKKLEREYYRSSRKKKDGDNL